MKNLIWNKVGMGIYETSNREFQARRMTYGAWLLLQRNDDTLGNWDWCQSYDLFRDVKNAAQSIFNTE